MTEIASNDIDVWETILNMPFTKDRKSKIELAFYSELIPDLYMSGLVPQLYLSAAQSTQHCLSGGMDDSVIYSFSIMGLQLGEQKEFEPAFKYEDLARDLSAKYPNTFGATRGMNGIVWCNMHSRSHPKEIVDYCIKSIQCGKNCGDLYNAGLSYGPLMWNLQVQGNNLSVIEDYAKECLQFSNRYHLSFSVGLAEAMQAGWVLPMKKDYLPVPMEEKLKAWEQDNHIASAGSYYVHMALTHYYFGEHEEAEKYLVGVRKYLSGLTDNVLKRQWHVFRVLNTLKLYEKGLGFKSEKELIVEIQPNIKKVETWAGLGPLLKPYLAFLYAEQERVIGEFKEARSLYLDAIEAARKQNYTLLEGHLNECLGEFLLQAGRCSEGIYFAEAARLYRKCGAERKESSLIEKHRKYFENEKTYRNFVMEPSSLILPDIDIEYLMKSSLAISAEVEQEALLKRIMNVVIESSGAGAGYLLIEEEGDLFIRAESHATNKDAVKTFNKKLDDVDDICKAIVRYVHRTGERVILNNAVQEGAFKDNPELKDMELHSVLCLPVIKQSKMIGVLYLENRLSDSVFTSGKTDMTELLISQAAISFENSRLIENMKKAGDQIKQSLREKEVLLKEVHHRVKNNLQIVHSMLNLQLPYIKDEQAIALFKESKNRIYSMALIHEKLYQSESLARINLPEYIQSLTDNLFLSYEVRDRIINPKIHIENVTLNVDKIIPCALIINELVSNSLKYAFPNSLKRECEKDEIHICLCHNTENEFRLTVSDNGIGLPKGLEIQNCESLGMKLVNVLVKQLKGTIQIGTNCGTEIAITFKA
jgi:two-component sensor histidine kinase